MFPKQTKKPTPTKASSNVAAKPNQTQENSKPSDLPLSTGKFPSNLKKPSPLHPKQPEIPQNIEQSLKISLKGPPVFQTVKITSLDQVKQIRVKFWKLKSCHLGKNPTTSMRVYSKLSRDFDDEDDKKYNPILQNFFNPTLKKSLKVTKKFKFINQKDLSLSSFKKLFPPMSKVQIIAFPINDFRESSDTFLKKYLNGQTTQLTLQLNFPMSLKRPQHFLLKFITLFKRLVRCESIIKMPDSLGMEMMKLKSPIRFCKSNEKHFFDQIIKVMITPSLEEISIEAYGLPPHSKKAFASPTSGLQNLKRLRYVAESQKLTDFSFIENSPNLQAVTIKIQSPKISSFDFLSRLAQLQELCIISREYQGTSQLPNLPPLTNLKKLAIILQKSTFNLPNIQKTIASNKNLEALHLVMSFKEILVLLQHDLKLPFLQELTLRDLEMPSDEAYPSLAFQKILARYKHVTRLIVDIGFSFSIAKPLEQLTSLTHLSIRNSYLFKEKPQKLAPLKELFTNLQVLKFLQIDFLDSWLNSEDLLTLATDLRFLKSLHSLEFRVYFKKEWSEQALSKLAKLLKSFNHLKKVNVKVSGFDGEKFKTIIGSVIVQDLQFWEKVDCFDIYPIPELYF